MTITIIEDKDFALGGTDVRSFKKDEVHTLLPDHEKELIDAGIAKEGGNEEDATAPAMTPQAAEIADNLKVSQAPQAVDTAAVAARVVADGVTHDSEGGIVAGSTNEEGPHVTHASDLLDGGQKAADPVDENKAVDPAAENKAAKPAAAKAKPHAATKKPAKK